MDYSSAYSGRFMPSKNKKVHFINFFVVSEIVILVENPDQSHSIGLVGIVDISLVNSLGQDANILPMSDHRSLCGARSSGLGSSVEGMVCRPPFSLETAGLLRTVLHAS